MHSGLPLLRTTNRCPYGVCVNKNALQTEKALASMLACHFRVAGWPSNGNARAELAYLRENIGDAMRRQFLRAPGFQGGTPWGRNVCLFATANKQTCDFGLPKSVFFRPFFVQRQRKGINAFRERAQRAV